MPNFNKMPFLAGIGNKNSGNFMGKVYSKLKPFFNKNGMVYCTYDKQSLDEAVRDVCEANPTLKFISGGDGAAIIILSRYFREFGDNEPLKVWYVPSGTIDKLGRELGILSMLAFGDKRDRQRDSFIDEVVHDIEQCNQLHMQTRDIIKVTLDGKNDAAFYAFDLGFGVPSEALLYYYTLDRDEITGEDMQNMDIKVKPSRALTTILKILGNIMRLDKVFDGIDAKITVDGRELHNGRYHHYIGAIISVNQHILPFFKLFYSALSRHGKAQLIATSKHQTEAVLFLPNLMFGWPLGSRTYDALAANMEVEFKAPEIVQMGGELKKCSYLKAEVLKNRVEFVVPRQRQYCIEEMAHATIDGLLRRAYLPVFSKIDNAVGRFL